MNLIQEAINVAAEIYEPDNGIGLLGLLIIGLPSTLTAIGTVVVLLQNRHRDRDQREIKERVGVIRDNVQNGHEDPLRADLDKQFGGIRSHLTAQSREIAEQGRDLRGVRREIGELRQRDIGELRGELRGERAARRELEKRIEDVERRNPGRDSP